MAASPDASPFEPQHDLAAGQLPRKVDLRPLMSPVEDQGRTSSCVANAVAGAYEYWIRRLGERDEDVSRLFVYYNARWRAGDQDEDAGSYIQLAMEGLGDFGACSESTWPFEPALLKQKPNRAAYEEAASFRVGNRQLVPLDLDAWRRCLAEGKPIVFGCILFESFDRCNELGGVVPMPDPQDLARESHGGHSMCCVGYSDVDGVFIVRNSWGADWGEDGYCYMPYNYLMNPKFNDGDCWVFVPDHLVPLPHDVWVSDDQPIVNRGEGVTFVINSVTVEEYSVVEIDFFEEIEVVEYIDEPTEDYSEYQEIVEEESWDDLDDFELEDALDAADEDDEEEGDEDEDEGDDEDEEDEDEEYEDDEEEGEDVDEGEDVEEEGEDVEEEGEDVEEDEDDEEYEDEDEGDDEE